MDVNGCDLLALSLSFKIHIFIVIFYGILSSVRPSIHIQSDHIKIIALTESGISEYDEGILIFITKPDLLRCIYIRVSKFYIWNF